MALLVPLDCVWQNPMLRDSKPMRGPSGRREIDSSVRWE